MTLTEIIACVSLASGVAGSAAFYIWHKRVVAKLVGVLAGVDSEVSRLRVEISRLKADALAEVEKVRSGVERRVCSACGEVCELFHHREGREPVCHDCEAEGK